MKNKLFQFPEGTIVKIDNKDIPATIEMLRERGYPIWKHQSVDHKSENSIQLHNGEFNSLIEVSKETISLPDFLALATGKIPESYCIKCTDESMKHPDWNKFLTSTGFTSSLKGWFYSSNVLVSRLGVLSPTEITIDTWAKVMDLQSENDTNVPHELNTEPEFVLPEKWCIQRKFQPKVQQWFNQRGFPGKDYSKELLGWFTHYPAFHQNSRHTSRIIEEGYTQITFEQFREHVLKEVEPSENTEQFDPSKPFEIANDPDGIWFADHWYIGKNKEGMYVCENQHGYITLWNFIRNIPEQKLEKGQPVLFKQSENQHLYDFGYFLEGDLVLFNGSQYHSIEIKPATDENGKLLLP